MSFEKVDVNTLTENPFKIIGIDWMLVTAGNINDYNTMTAAWGGLGFLWQKNVAICYIRPQRYTYQFAEKNEYFTLTFFVFISRSRLKTNTFSANPILCLN